MWWVIQFIHKRVLRHVRTLPRSLIQSSRAKTSSAPLNKQYLYAIRYNDGRKDALFKVGKTCNLEQRLRSYRTLLVDGEWFHTIECKDMHFSEKLLHGLLKQKGYHVQREIFRGRGNVIKSVMNLVEQLDRILVNDGTNQQRIDSLTSMLKNL